MKRKLSLSMILALFLNAVSADTLTQSKAINLALNETNGQVISVEFIEGETTSFYNINISSGDSKKVVTKVIQVSLSNVDVVLQLIR